MTGLDLYCDTNRLKKAGLRATAPERTCIDVLDGCDQLFVEMRGLAMPRYTAVRPDPDADWRAVNWGPHTHDAVVRGRRVRYVDVGTGRPLILIHGQGGCWQWWLRNIPTLATRYRVIALDLAGYGESDPVGTGHVVFDEQIATVVGLLDWLSLPSGTLVGHSMGGLVALEVASRHPDRVSELVLVDAGGAYFSPARLRILMAGFRVFNALFSVPRIPLMVANHAPLRRAMFAIAVGDRRSLSRALALEIVPRMAAPGFLDGAVSAAAAVGLATPEAVSCRCLVIWGSRDRILPVSTGDQLASRIPDARFEVVGEVGHCVMFEKPDEFHQLIMGMATEAEQRTAG